MSLNTVIIIPSRIGSTRLKNKPLVDISGKSLIHRVYENALLCTPNVFVGRYYVSRVVSFHFNLVFFSADIRQFLLRLVVTIRVQICLLLLRLCIFRKHGYLLFVVVYVVIVIVIIIIISVRRGQRRGGRRRFRR